MKKIYPAALFFFLFCIICNGQSQPVPLRPDITVGFVKSIPKDISGIAKDPVTGNLYMINFSGLVYEVKNLGTPGVYDTLLFTDADHGIGSLRGILFDDSTLFLIGNTLIDSTTTVGKIVRGDLQPNSLRAWTIVAQTDTYPQSRTAYDHGLSGLVFNPTHDSLYFNSGARTDHGEVQSNGGIYPGVRDVPLTTCIFHIPASAANLLLPDDSTSLAPYIFARGIRNSFELSFTADGDLIGLENAGDRDDPDELNWLREGRHYGFPWAVGGDTNPQQFPGYDPSADAFINKQQHSYINGYFYNDSTFPPPLAGITFTSPALNYGPDADKFRDVNDLTVKDASDMGSPMTTFTPHRCPVGMVMDYDSLLINDLRGDAFMIGYSSAGDSTGLGINGLGTLLDSSEDLVHVKLIKNIAIDNYEIYCTRIVAGFHRPVDDCIIGNKIYVVENVRNNQDTAYMWEITLPLLSTSFNNQTTYKVNSYIYPNPASKFTLLSYSLQGKEKGNFVLTDVTGKIVLKEELDPSAKAKRIDLSKLHNGIYFYKVLQKDIMIDAGKIVVDKQ
ncbi:MAG: T9SS type A sorting domain-containing protein [Bacteroidia bacterium]